MALLRFVFELYLGGVWVDVTSYVRHQKVTVTRGTSDEAPKLTPAKAALRLENGDDRFNPRNPTGPYFGLLLRNTPLRVSCAGGVSDAYRFHGEVFAFEPRWNENRTTCWVDVEANGALRRIIANKVTPQSYYRAWLNTRTLNPKPVYHWALEEEADATAGAPDIGGTYAVFTNPPVNGKGWGQAKMNDWTPNGVLIDNLNTLTFPCDMRGSTAAAWEVAGLLTATANETVTQVEINCDTHVWYIQLYSPGPDYNETWVLVIRPDGTVIIPGSGLFPLKEAGPIWFVFRVWFTGSELRAYLALSRVSTVTNNITVTTVTTMSATAPVYTREIKVSSVANTPDNTSTTSATGLKDLSVSTCSTSTGNMNLSYIASKGGGGQAEHSDDRFTRLCNEQGINNSASPFGMRWMGRQYVQPFEDHLLEILSSTRHSAIVESRSANELQLLGLAPNRGAIDLSEIVPDLEPAEDDKNTANIVQLDNSHNHKATLTKAAGTMSVAEIGPFEGKLKTNNWYTSEALALAGLALARGTWAGPRFKELTVSAVTTPARYAFYRSIEVGDFISLTGMEVNGYYDDMLFRVTSIRESIDQTDHRFTFTVRPGEIEYNLWTVGTSRLDAAGSTVVSDGGSTLTVTPSSLWDTTAVPFDVMVSGERMTVTAATATTLTVTRSVNGVVKTAPVGAEVHLYPPNFVKAVD